MSENIWVPAEESALWQAQLGALLQTQLRRYTMGDSSSVRYETAQALLASVAYTVAVGRQSRPETGMDDIEALFAAGRREIAARVKKGRKLLFLVRYTRLDIDNAAYLDTYVALKDFFGAYDTRFFAHEVPCLIDYQLAGGQPEGYQGIDYINAYLSRLLLENRFCRCFETARIAALLKVYVPDYREQVVNLYEPVAANALGRVLLGAAPQPLDISARQAGELHAMLAPKAPEYRRVVLAGAAKELCGALSLPEDVAAYVAETAAALLPRLAAVGAAGYHNIFLSLAGKSVPEEENKA